MREPILPYRCHPKYNAFIVVARGEIYFQQLFDHVEQLLSDPEYQSGMNGLYDFREVTALKGDITKFESLASNMSDKDIIAKPAKTAIIINQSQTSVRAMMRGYLLMTSSSTIDYKIFDEDHIHRAKHHVDLPDDFDISIE